MLQYQILHYRSAAWQAADDLQDVKPDLTRFDTLTAEQLKEREDLIDEARANLQTRFGNDYSEKRLDFAEQQIWEMLPKEEWELRNYWRKMRHAAKETRGYRKIQVNDGRER